MNSMLLTENLFSLHPLDNEDLRSDDLLNPDRDNIRDALLDDFFGYVPSFTNYSGFIKPICDDYDYREEAFNMQHLLISNELVGGIAIQPTFPTLVSLDLSIPLIQLHMYTNNMHQLAAPAELSVQKAIELIGSRKNYEMNLEAFRLELITETVGELAILDVNALIKGIDCLSKYLLAYFDNVSQLDADFFPYEFNCLHQNRYLFLSKIVFDATLSLPVFNPSTVAKPAHTYSEVQARVREADLTPAYFCPVI